MDTHSYQVRSFDHTISVMSTDVPFFTNILSGVHDNGLAMSMTDTLRRMPHGYPTSASHADLRMTHVSSATGDESPISPVNHEGPSSESFTACESMPYVTSMSGQELYRPFAGASPLHLTESDVLPTPIRRRIRLIGNGIVSGVAQHGDEINRNLQGDGGRSTGWEDGLQPTYRYPSVVGDPRSEMHARRCETHSAATEASPAVGETHEPSGSRCGYSAPDTIPST
jgi:hypothetical protein